MNESDILIHIRKRILQRPNQLQFMCSILKRVFNVYDPAEFLVDCGLWDLWKSKPYFNNEYNPDNAWLCGDFSSHSVVMRRKADCIKELLLTKYNIEVS